MRVINLLNNVSDRRTEGRRLLLEARREMLRVVTRAERLDLPDVVLLRMSHQQRLQGS